MVGEKTTAYENTLSQFGVSHKALIKENTHDEIATLVHNYDHVIFSFHELRFTTKAAHDEYWKYVDHHQNGKRAQESCHCHSSCPSHRTKRRYLNQ